MPKVGPSLRWSAPDAASGERAIASTPPPRPIRIAALGKIGAICMVVLLVVALLVFTPPWLERAPCTPSALIHPVAGWAAWLALPVAAGLMLLAIVRPQRRLLVLAVALPALTWPVHLIAAGADAARQETCRQWTREQAFARCRADPAVYVESRDSFGYPVLTLVTPGVAGREHDCLWAWSQWNGSVSIVIDDSVYEEARRKAARK